LHKELGIKNTDRRWNSNEEPKSGGIYIMLLSTNRHIPALVFLTHPILVDVPYMQQNNTQRQPDKN
jgi:hypothetical protein